ncbi:hypothetical protein F383_17811 [Gossypium arboreum]|uniref:Uncharacterized protein n=1 Tax=Gossypium arboreum TaxID=29729 RepID=A0A0B0MD24_GOSAR|nr:hypothetical protein F383_17811 [Gossypium arboreum]
MCLCDPGSLCVT